MTLKNNSSMKRMAICLSALAVWCGAAAQETVPPRFQGSDAKRFMARLIGETEKIVDAAQIPAAELSSQVVVGFTVDETGNVTQWRFLDRTCAGKDSVGVEPATPRTREAMTEALGRLEKWTPAMKDGKPTTYSWRLTRRLPVEKSAKKQDADPLLFLGGDPDKTFHEWASLRLRYDGRFTGRGAKGEGVVRVRFYIEPDGKITIGDNVFIAPNVCIVTEEHAMDVEQRLAGLEYTHPVTIGDNVWICTGAIILPGVTIGANSVVGAGSVVTKDIPPRSLAVGNPCRVIRTL